MPFRTARGLAALSLFGQVAISGAGCLGSFEGGGGSVADWQGVGGTPASLADAAPPSGPGAVPVPVPAPAPLPAPAPEPAPAPAPAPDPFLIPPVCTSQRYYTNGTGPRMRPGDNCLDCHNFAAAGTVYPTGHEPRWCNGVDGNGTSRGATVVVVDATGRSVSAAVNQYGNFFLGGRLTPPLRAKVVFEGRERAMAGQVPTGACNRCHSQNGGTFVAGGLPAPGRILLP